MTQHKELEYLLGTIFNDGLIHIWLSSVYLGQQICVCHSMWGIKWKTTVLMFSVMKEPTSLAHLSVNSFWKIEEEDR